MQNLKLSQQEAAQLTLDRRAARRNLIDFTRFSNDTYTPAQHHHKIAEALEAVERGDLDRLMLFMPPRHGKSELASRRFPAWYLGRNPDKQIIAASYNSDLANDFGREVRNIIASGEFQALFPGVSLAPDSRAANRWHTSHGGSYVSAGVGTAITGRGAHIGLIDDPIKDQAEADSETIRDSVYDWYTSTFYTRLMPGGAVILIQTRWNDDDLGGRLLNDESSGGDKWHVVEMPAIDEGKALWPEWYPIDALERIKAVLPSRQWSALYQQKPVPDEGDFFKKDWFRYYDNPPKREYLQIYGASDYAVTDGGGDFTEHGIFGVDFDDNIYLLDWWRGQTDAEEWIENQLDLVAKYKPVTWYGEGGPIAKAIEPILKKRARERRDYCRFEWMPSIHDKPTRARPFQARLSMGKVYFPKTDWADTLTRQMLRFPAGVHDDGVDVLSLIGRALDELHTPNIKPTPVKEDITRRLTLDEILANQPAPGRTRI